MTDAEREAQIRAFYAEGVKRDAPPDYSAPFLLRLLDEARAERDALLAHSPDHRHHDPCLMCGKPCNDLAGNPALWSLRLSNSGRHHVGCVNAALRELARLQADRDAAWARSSAYATEIARLTFVVERDRSAVAQGVSDLERAIAARNWLREGRGSFAYDDDLYQAEFGAALDEIEAASVPLKRIAADLTDSPRKWKDVQAARLQAPPAVSASARARAAMREECEQAIRGHWLGERTRAWRELEDVLESIRALTKPSG